MASPTLADAASTQDEQAVERAIDAIYDAPYVIFVYAAWAGATWVFGDTVALAVLIAGTAALTAAGLGQRAPFRSHSFAADLATILLFCSAAIGAGWFVVQGLSAEPLVTTLGLSATLAATVAIALGRDED
ncbi:MAG: hypothetical protein AAF480_02760 [Actinomycetota bacterium]